MNSAVTPLVVGDSVAKRLRLGWVRAARPRIAASALGPAIPKFASCPATMRTPAAAHLAARALWFAHTNPRLAAL